MEPRAGLSKAAEVATPFEPAISSLRGKRLSRLATEAQLKSLAFRVVIKLYDWNHAPSWRVMCMFVLHCYEIHTRESTATCFLYLKGKAMQEYH